MEITLASRRSRRRTAKGLSQAQKAQILREAVSFYIRQSLREPEVQAVCEEFIAAIDEKARDDAAAALPDVPAVSISPTSATVPAAGGTGSIAVAITAPGVSGTWTVDKDADATWLTFTPMTPQSTDGTVEYTAAANTDAAARDAHFYINGKTFTLNQDGATAAVVSIEPKRATVLADGGSGDIAVTITTPGAWAVDRTPGWVTCTPDTPQSADGTVSYTASQNTTGLPRQAFVAINGEVFTLDQGAV
jgi:Putative binding domain, N-terminal